VLQHMLRVCIQGRRLSCQMLRQHTCSIRQGFCPAMPDHASGYNYVGVLLLNACVCQSIHGTY
jgi:hypothetical protein